MLLVCVASWVGFLPVLAPKLEQPGAEALPREDFNALPLAVPSPIPGDRRP